MPLQVRSAQADSRTKAQTSPLLLSIVLTSIRSRLQYKETVSLTREEYFHHLIFMILQRRRDDLRTVVSIDLVITAKNSLRNGITQRQGLHRRCFVAAMYTSLWWICLLRDIDDARPCVVAGVFYHNYESKNKYDNDHENVVDVVIKRIFC